MLLRTWRSPPPGGRRSDPRIASGRADVRGLDSGLGLDRLADSPNVRGLVRRGEGSGLGKPLASAPSHEAGERGEAALPGVRRNARQLEDLVGNLGIQV